jgi:hypothetical protein
MRHFKPIALCLGLLPAAVLAQRPSVAGLTRVDLASPQPAVISSLAPYLESRGAQFLDWLADGSMLVTTRFGETTQVHHVRAPLAMREQLSFEPDGVSAAAAQPAHDTAFVALESRAGGNAALSLEQPQQHLSVSLTDGSARDGAALWSHDGQRLVFSSHHGTGSEREIYLLDTRTLPATPTLVAGGGDARWQVFDWSLDDQRLLLGRSCECVAGEVELYMVQLGAELGRAEPTALALVPTAAPAATPDRELIEQSQQCGGLLGAQRHPELRGCGRELHRLVAHGSICTTVRPTTRPWR